MEDKKFFRITALIIALGLVSLLIIQFVLAKETPAKKKCEDDQLAVLRTMLAKIPSSDVQARRIIEGNIGMYEKIAALCETITPATIDPNFTPEFLPYTPRPFVTGIFDGQPGAFYHAFEAKIENPWKGIVNGNRVTVFAGAWADDPSQGFIALMIDPQNGHQSVWSNFPSATNNHIISPALFLSCSIIVIYFAVIVARMRSEG